MQNRKKQILAVSFLAGIIMFTATAFADITAESGYETYKSAIKNTAAAFTKQLDSFTLETIVSLKDNDKVLMTQKTLAKADIRNNMGDDSEIVEYANGEKEDRYSYSDNKTQISHSNYNEAYFVTEYEDENRLPFAEMHYRNPFEEERAKDMEKVFDALVGDLKNYVMVEAKDDGSKKIFGTLDESQIPPLANALATLGIKQFVNDQTGRSGEKAKFPELVDEIYIKKIVGNADISKDNIAENNLATFIISGKDKNGEVHNLTLDIVFKLYDINSTQVVKPDLTGKKVNVNKVEKDRNSFEIDDRYLGKWRNDIIDVKDGQIGRKATRYITITSVDSEKVKGNYYEKRYDEENKTVSFDFEAKIAKAEPAEVRVTGSVGKPMVVTKAVRSNSAEFEYTDSSGSTRKEMLNFNPIEINLSSMDGQGLEYGQFQKVFDEAE